MKHIIRLYQLFNILSLDIASGAVICALFFARLLNVSILPYGLIALALTVWAIYTADHLRDAKNIGKSAASERHRFHQQYFKTLFVLAILAIAADAVIILFIRKEVLNWGVMLAALVLVYLGAQRYLKFLKELVIALLYTGGVLLPSLAVTAVSINGFHAALIAQFALIAFTNLLIFSWFDSEADVEDRQNSFVTVFGRPFTAQCIWLLLSVNLATGVVLWFVGADGAAVATVMSMNAVLIFIFAFRHRLQHYYRLPGDAVFFIPLIYLLLL
jgi:hypothetical protein